MKGDPWNPVEADDLVPENECDACLRHKLDCMCDMTIDRVYPEIAFDRRHYDG